MVRLLTAEYERTLRDHSLSLAEFDVLLAFARRDERVPVTVIARDLAQPHTSVARVVAKLAARGFLEPHWLTIRRTYYVLSAGACVALAAALKALRERSTDPMTSPPEMK